MTKKDVKEKQRLSLIEAISSDNGLGKYFKDKATWQAWFTFFKALSGSQELTSEELDLVAANAQAWIASRVKRSKRLIWSVAVVVANQQSVPSWLYSMLCGGNGKNMSLKASSQRFL